MKNAMKCSLLLAISAITLLSACSQTAAPARTIAPQNVMSYDALNMLTGLNPGQSAQLATSPWGNNVNVTLLRKYHAATGFACMQLKLAQRQALACQTADNLWVAEPAFSQ